LYDIHSHILPEVDDGARSLKETKAMLEMAYQQGIRGIIATPHYHGRLDPSIFELWRRAYRRTEKAARAIADDLMIYQGAEIYYDAAILSVLKQGAPITLANSSYVLLEFPYEIDFTYLSFAVNELRYQGYYPILAHIERYQVLRNSDNVVKLREYGAHMQINAAALISGGFVLRGYLLKLIKKGLIDVIGTDMHNTTTRPAFVSKCANILDKKVGKEERLRLFQELYFDIVNER